jgi:replicative DNA helicase
MLIDRYAPDAVFEILDAGDFYGRPNREIFASMFDLYQSNQPIDLTTVAAKLVDKKSGIDAVKLVDLAEGIASAANVVSYAERVRDRSVRRKLIEINARVANEAFGAELSSDELLELLDAQVYGLWQRTAAEDYSPVCDIVPAAIAELEAVQKAKNGITGVPTGYDKLDDLTAGLQAGDMIVLAARPSQGKTAFALNIALNAARRDCPVGFFSIEMTNAALVRRMLSSLAMVDSHKARRGRLNPVDWSAIVNAASRLSDVKLFLDQVADTLPAIRQKARRMIRQHGVKLLIVDYLQIMRMARGERYNGDTEKTTALSAGIKQLAKELNLPILILSQLSRASVGDKPRKPVLSDLRQSGAIEQDADVVVFIHRPEAYGIMTDQDYGATEGKAEIHVAKQRNGPTGELLLRFVKEYGVFQDVAPYEAPENGVDF